MSNARRALFSTVAIVCGGLPGVALAALATPDQLNAMVQGGQYTDAILGCNTLLNQTGDDAVAVDRARVFAIKGEAHLQVHAYNSAAEAFDHAAAAEASDDKVAGFDRAMADLIRHSRQGAYTPKPPAAAVDAAPVDPIDILNRANRKSAFAALFADESKADEPQFKSASSASSITVVMNAMTRAQRLDELEVAATGKDAGTQTQTEALSDHGQALITGTLQKMDAQISRVVRAARQSQRRSEMAMNGGGGGGFGGGFGGGPGGGGGGFRSAGFASASLTPSSSGQSARAALSPSTVSELNDIITTAKKLEAAATAFSKMSTDDAKWASLNSDAQRTASRAQDVLDGNLDAPPTAGDADANKDNARGMD